MASYQYSNEILLGRAEPGKGNYESVYSNEFATAWTSGGDTTAYQPASAINLLKRFADIIAVSGTNNGAAIYSAVNGLDGLGVPSNS